MTRTTAVLGFRPHTYWTAVVALAGAPDAPQVLERRRVDFAAGDERSVYHHAEQLPRDEADAWVARVWEAVEPNARRAVAELIAALAEAGVSMGVAVVPIGRGKQPDALDDILKSTPTSMPPKGTSTGPWWRRPARASGWRCAASSSATCRAWSAAALGLRRRSSTRD